MNKHILYALCLTILAAGFSACKRVDTKEVDNKETIVYMDGTKVEKTLKVTPGEPKPKKEAPKKEPKIKRGKSETSV